MCFLEKLIINLIIIVCVLIILLYTGVIKKSDVSYKILKARITDVAFDKTSVNGTDILSIELEIDGVGKCSEDNQDLIKRIGKEARLFIKVKNGKVKIIDVMSDK